jgi:hypothetical protein
LHTPVFAFPRYLECEIALPIAGVSAVDMRDLHRYRAFEHELLCIDRHYHPFDGQKVRISATFLRPFNAVNPGVIGNSRSPKIIPAYPLKRKLMLAEQHRGRGFIVYDRSFLR